VSGKRKTTLSVGRLRTQGSAGDGREEKEELWSVHAAYHQKETGRQSHMEDEMTKKTIYQYREAMGSRSRSGGMLGNREQITEGSESGI
jgi:hypothetical protein